MSSADVVTALAALGGLGGLTVTGIANLLDYFTGDANITNSGEYLANSAITAIPLGTAAAGAGLVMATDPVARELVGVVGDTAAAREVASQYGGDALMNLMSGNQTATPDMAAVEEAKQRVDRRAGRLTEEVLRGIAANPKLAAMDPQAAAELLVNRGGHRLARSASLGALVGSIPAVLLMQDQKGAPQKREER